MDLIPFSGLVHYVFMSLYFETYNPIDNQFLVIW